MAGPPSPSPIAFAPSLARHRLLPPPPTAQVCLRTLHLFIGSGGGRGWMEGGFENFCDFPKDFWPPLSLSSRLLAERKRGNNCTYLKPPRGDDALSPLRHLTCGRVSGNLDSDSVRVNLRRGRKRSELFETDIHTNIPCAVYRSSISNACTCIRSRLLPSGPEGWGCFMSTRGGAVHRDRGRTSRMEISRFPHHAPREIYAHNAPLSVCLKQV